MKGSTYITYKYIDTGNLCLKAEKLFILPTICLKFHHSENWLLPLLAKWFLVQHVHMLSWILRRTLFLSLLNWLWYSLLQCYLPHHIFCMFPVDQRLKYNLDRYKMKWQPFYTFLRRWRCFSTSLLYSRRVFRCVSTMNDCQLDDVERGKNRRADGIGWEGCCARFSYWIVWWVHHIVSICP